MPVSRSSTVGLLAVTALVTACAGPVRRAERAERYDDRVAVAPVPARGAYAQYGQVVDIRTVGVASRSSAGGAVLGAVIGGLVGNQFGSGGGRALATGAGAVGGAVIGNNIEQRQRGIDEVYRVGVRFEDGTVRDFDFQRIDDLRVGDRVRWEQGQLHRV